MKTKGMILALVAVVFAIGSAFTSKNVDLANNVNIWLKQTPTSSFICTTQPLECAQQPSGILCDVRIVKADATQETVNAYGNQVCTVQLRHTTTSALVGT